MVMKPMTVFKLLDTQIGGTWEKKEQFLATGTYGHEPSWFFEAVRDPLWWHAIEQEIDALKRNDTWTLATLPPRKKAIGYK
ncbi:hypothetical protein CR513_26580, partial [Mucuna pruriens]